MPDITHLLGLTMESRLGGLSSTQLSFIANSSNFPEGSRREAEAALQGRFDKPAVPVTTLDPAEAEGVQQFFTGVDTLGGASAAPAIDPGAVFPGLPSNVAGPVIAPVDTIGAGSQRPNKPGFFQTAGSNVAASIGPGLQGGTVFDFPGEERLAPIAPTAAGPDENAIAVEALRALGQKGGAGVAPPVPITGADIPKSPPVGAAGKAAEVPSIGASEGFEKAQADLEGKVKSIIDAFSDSEAVADIDEQGIKQSGVLGGAARAAFIALQDPRSGFAQLGIGGIILAAGLGAVQGLAKAEASIRAENKEARLEKAKFGANKAELMLELQKVVTALSQTGLTNETRIGIANLNAVVAKLEADNVAARHADAQQQRGIANALAGLRVQIATVAEGRAAEQGERRLALQEGAAERAQTGVPPATPTGDAVEDAAQKVASQIVAGLKPDAVPQEIVDAAAEEANERVLTLAPTATSGEREQLRKQAFNQALVERLRLLPELLLEVSN